MFKTGIRLMVARSVRSFGPNLIPTSRASQVSRLILQDPLWERSSNRNWQLWQLSSPLLALSVTALTAGSNAHVQADDSKEDVILREQNHANVKDERSDDITSELGIKSELFLFVGFVEKILYEQMDSQSRALCCGIAGANVVVYSAFALALFLWERPKGKSALLRILSRNFLLSPGWLSRGRWHVLLTYSLTHVRLLHLVWNTLGLMLIVPFCSRFLDARHIAGLYFGGALVGGILSMFLMKKLRKPRYLSQLKGGSSGVYAIMSYYMCTLNLEVADQPSSIPSGLIIKTALVCALLWEAVGLRKYIRYGFKGNGRNGVTSDHAGHLGGAVTGLLSCEVSRVLDYFPAEVNVKEDNKRKEEEERTGDLQESIVAKYERAKE